MESEEYMNRKSRKQRGEAEVSILIIIIIIIITVIVREYTQRDGGGRGLTMYSYTINRNRLFTKLSMFEWNADLILPLHGTVPSEEGASFPLLSL